MRFFLLFLFGALTLTVFDAFHTLSGTTAYAGAYHASRLEWWTPVLMGAGTAIGGSIYAGVYRVLGAPKDPPPWSVIASSLWCFGALYFFSGFYHGSNVTKLVVLSVSGVAAFWWLDRTWQGAVCTLILTVAGPLVEIGLVRAGTFVPLQPDVLGIPMWLPALYFCAGSVIGHGSRRILMTSALGRNDTQSMTSPALP